MENKQSSVEKKLAKAKAAMTNEEILSYAKEEMIELSPEMLESVAGGAPDVFLPDQKPNDYHCIRCKSANIAWWKNHFTYNWWYECRNCGFNSWKG